MHLSHRPGRRGLALLTLLTFVIGAMPLAAPARASDSPLSSSDTVAPTTVVGVVAAIGCGFGIRYWPVVVAGGAGMIAAEIGLCSLALLDGLGTKEA